MSSFARTKIQAPRPRAGSLLARPALDARLNHALRTQRLVLLCAAAGFGKTSALARRVEDLPAGTALAWVACDADDSPLRLFRCLVAALDPYDLPWRTEPDSLLAGVSRADPPAVRQRALRATTAELINALDACDVPHGVIVIDDLHRVEHSAVFEFLNLMLERFPPRWTLVIATRLEPPLALARLRAQDEMVDFRATDLCFSLAETRELCAAAGLAHDVADALFKRTQGWPAGLKLAMSVAAGASSPSLAALSALGPVIDRRVFDFLASEVVDRLPAALREFLLITSVLHELTASRCAGLSGDAQAGLRLDEVESAGLFVDVLEGHEQTLRLHALLRSALLQRLQRERPAEVPGLYARAAAAETDPARRVGYLLRAGDLSAAADALREHAPGLLTQGALSVVARLLEQFPPGAESAQPALMHVQGLLAWGRWNFEAMASAMRSAQSAYQAQGDVERAQLALGYHAVALNALGRTDSSDSRLSAPISASLSTETQLVVLLARLWNALDLGPQALVGPLLDEMLDLLETSNDLSLWYRGHPLPRLNGIPGTARALDRYVAGAMRLTADNATPLRALALTQRALRELWAGRFEPASASLAAARADSLWLGEPPNVRGSLQLIDTLMTTLAGQREAAAEAVRVMLAEHPRQRGPWSWAMHLYYGARTAGAFEDLPALRQALSELASLRGRFSVPMDEKLLPLVGQRAWLEGDRPAAIQAWTEALAVEAVSDRLGSAIECRLRLCAAQLEAGDDAAARRTLAPAVERVAHDAGLGGVLYARRVLATLAQAAERGRLDAQLARAVSAWQVLAAARGATGDGEPGCAASRKAATAPNNEDLSGRELEVLSRIAAGDSNKLIARAFDLSPHTVKRHVANILDKLDLRSRGQAAAWYREHAP